MDLPSTIHSPGLFIRADTPGNDGVFDWTWVEDAWRDTHIRPTDLDCVIERYGQFLVMETKRNGLAVPVGQMITLKRLMENGNVTVFIVHGKETPIEIDIWYHNGRTRTVSITNKSEATALVEGWRKFAESTKNPHYRRTKSETARARRRKR